MDRLFEKPLVLRDELHGDMAFDGILRAVIDHPGFQRLRHIRQMGLADYVFPCANHTRFQHSLGACYLAEQYYESLVKSWLTSPFRFDGALDGVRFLASKTLSTIEQVAADYGSNEYWRNVLALAALLHDVGHGPWSHTFEFLEIHQDFSEEISGLSGMLREYFDQLIATKQQMAHEDLSLLYVARILRDLQESNRIDSAERYLVPVSSLINRKLVETVGIARIESSLETLKRTFGILGGPEFHRLLRPLISGPFDVDRMDYIQRDGRNTGVHIGGIEWRRILSKVLPCLIETTENVADVALVSNIKNQHVIDDFIFSRFQMYAQVYLHPKVVGLESILRGCLKQGMARKPFPTITFDRHQRLTDERFREIFREECGVTEVDQVLLRMPDSSFEVATFPADSGMDSELTRSGYTRIELHDKPMLKDTSGIYLYSTFQTAERQKGMELRSWGKVSPLAAHFTHFTYAPQIWLRRERSQA